MSNIEFLGIYENQIDKVIGLAEDLVSQVDYDLDDFNSDVYAFLNEESPSFKNLTPAILYAYLSEASEVIKKEFEKYGFEVNVDFENDGYYSSISINRQNQSVLQAASDIINQKFDFVDGIKDITNELLKNTTSLDNYFHYFVDEITGVINEDYGLDLDYHFEDYKVAQYVKGRDEKVMSVLEFRDEIKNIVKEKEKDAKQATEHGLE